MENIRKAQPEDLTRIAEILIFNYRLNFYPIFKNDEYYFCDLQVPAQAEEHSQYIDRILVYDDGAVKGFITVDGSEVKQLFVEPVLHGQGIGAKLLDYAVSELHADHLWALEKNTRAIAFYRRHGFSVSTERKLEEDTTEYLVKLVRT